MDMKDWGVDKWLLVCFILNSPGLKSLQAQQCPCTVVIGVPTQCPGVIVIGVWHNNFVVGRIGICDKSGWRAVCDAGWDMKDAMVVCRQLGFPIEGTQYCTESCFGGNPEYNGATNFRCTGNEQSLLNCSYNRSNTRFVTNSNNERVRPCDRYAGVLCSTPRTCDCTDMPSHCPEKPCDSITSAVSMPYSSPCNCDKVSGITTTSYSSTNATTAKNGITSNSASGGAATTVLGVMCALLLLILVGVVIGWVWFCHRNSHTVNKQRRCADNNIHNPTYSPTTPTIPSAQYSLLGPRDTPTTDHTSTREENVYHLLSEIQEGGAYEIPRQRGRDERTTYSTLHHN